MPRHARLLRMLGYTGKQLQCGAMSCLADATWLRCLVSLGRLRWPTTEQPPSHETRRLLAGRPRRECRVVMCARKRAGLQGFGGGRGRIVQDPCTHKIRLHKAGWAPLSPLAGSCHVMPYPGRLLGGL